MSKVRRDEHGLYVVAGGSIVRPPAGFRSQVIEGQIKTKQIKGSPMFKVGDEYWIATRDSKEMCNATGKPFDNSIPKEPWFEVWSNDAVALMNVRNAMRDAL